MQEDYKSLMYLEDFCLVSYLAVLGFPIESIKNEKNYSQCSFFV